MSLHGFQVSNFVSNITKNGVAYPFRYEIEFGSLGTTGRMLFESDEDGFNAHRDTMETINSRLQAVSFPSVTIASKGHNLMGIEREMPYGRLYEGDITLSFLETHDYTIRKAFTEWQNKIVDPMTFQHGFYDEYTTIMIVKTFPLSSKDDMSFGFDLGTMPSYSVVVDKVFPKTIDVIELSAGAEELVKTQVILSYRSWERYISSSSLPKQKPIPPKPFVPAAQTTNNKPKIKSPQFGGPPDIPADYVLDPQFGGPGVPEDYVFDLPWLD